MSMTIRSSFLVSGAARHTNGLLHTRKYSHMRSSLQSTVSTNADSLFQTRVASRSLAQRFTIHRRWLNTSSKEESKSKSESDFKPDYNRIIILNAAGAFIAGGTMVVILMLYPNGEDHQDRIQKILLPFMKIRKIAHPPLPHTDLVLFELEKLTEMIKENYQKDLKILQQSIELIQQSTPEATAQAKKNEKTLEIIYRCRDEQCLIDIHNFLTTKTSTVSYIGKSPDHFKTNFAMLLAEALENDLNPSVTHLDFGNSDLKTKYGFLAIIQSLGKNNTIEMLNLSYTDIGYDDPTRSLIREIATMLESNKTLKELDLYYTYVEKRDLDILGKALEKNQTLRRINLGKTSISSLNDIRSFEKRINYARKNPENTFIVEHTLT